MEHYQTGAVRDTGGKGRMDLLPWCALLRVSKHMEDAILPDPDTGIPHYPERNWEKGLPMHSMIDSAFRHLAKYVDGQNDEDHLCAAATNLLMAMWMEEKRPDMQDIPTRPLDPREIDMSLAEFCSKSCEHHLKDRCLATKDTERVECGGDLSKCSLRAQRQVTYNDVHDIIEE
jgi:hypothetical protein